MLIFEFIKNGHYKIENLIRMSVMAIPNPSQNFLLFTVNPFSKHNKNKTHQTIEIQSPSFS